MYIIDLLGYRPTAEPIADVVGLNDFGVNISSLKAVLESGDMSQEPNNDSGS